MYGHMSVFKRTGADVLRPSDNAASGPGDLGGGVAPEDVAGAPKSFLFSTGHGARANGVPQARKTLRERVGASNKPHGGGSVKAQKRGGNIRRMVQGRSHRVTAADNDAGDSAFSKYADTMLALSADTRLLLTLAPCARLLPSAPAPPQVQGCGGRATWCHQREAAQPKGAARCSSRRRGTVTGGRWPRWCPCWYACPHHGQRRQGAHAVARRRPKLSRWRSGGQRKRCSPRQQCHERWHPSHRARVQASCRCQTRCHEGPSSSCTRCVARHPPSPGCGSTGRTQG